MVVGCGLWVAKPKTKNPKPKTYGCRLLIFISVLVFARTFCLADMKTWWFFGYEQTTNEGITADLKALRDAGFSGVVWYDQNHRNAKDKSLLSLKTPEPAFSPEWWQHLRFAAEEAQRMKMTFEINLSNGYVAGGKWIDAEHAMQRVASAETTIDGGDSIQLTIPEITGRDGYVKDIALIAFPIDNDGAKRHITVSYRARGKGKTGAMQEPKQSQSTSSISNDGNSNRKFSGALWKQLPDIGVLQKSNDSATWTDIVRLEPMYNSQGGYPIRTYAFPATNARYYRIKYFGSDTLRSYHLGCEPKLTRWEEKAALHSDFALPYPAKKDKDGISISEIKDLTPMLSKDATYISLPSGRWRILRLAAVITGAKSKHGRENLLGYECDKLSEEAALLHWNSYTQVIIDSLNPTSETKKQKLLSGVTMDSHEAGSQNWTPRMLEMFRKYRGYDLNPWLPILAGYIVESEEETENVLRDIRQTVNDCMRDNYYGTFQRMAHRNNLTFTAQAIGNALCITGDAISVKKAVE